MIIAAAVVSLVAGCTGGDDDRPGALPSVTPSAAAEPDPTPSDELAPAATPATADEPTPEPRDGMHEYSPAGVDAFTRYVIDVINYSYRTNDVELLKSISTNDCQFCANTMERLTFIEEEGGRIEGGQLQPTQESFDIIGPAEGFQTSAGVYLVIAKARTIDDEGVVRDSANEVDRYIIFDFARESEQWSLAEARHGRGE